MQGGFALHPSVVEQGGAGEYGTNKLVKKYMQDTPEQFEPHWMYKGDDKVFAKKPEDHDKLKKKGYTHDNPSTGKVEK